MSDEGDHNEGVAVARGGSGGGAAGEEELASKALQIQSKRFYLDVKHNARGRFLKIAEIGAGGRKSRILMSMSMAAEFHKNLVEFDDFYANLEKEEQKQEPSEDGRLRSAFMTKDNRRYYLDLKENPRGIFLRVAQTTLRGPRSQIAIPAQGLGEFKDALNELLQQFGTGDYEGSEDLPESRSMRVENKTFYFDVGSNARGTFLRVSEVRPTLRTAITIPQAGWAQFHQIMAEFMSGVEASSEPEEELAAGDA